MNETSPAAVVCRSDGSARPTQRGLNFPFSASAWSAFVLRGITVALLLLTGHNASAGDLLSFYNLAVVNDPNFQASLKDRDVARELAIQGHAQLLPSISLQAGMTQVDAYDDTFYRLQTTAHTSTTDGTYKTLSVQAVQPIFNLDRLNFSDEEELRAAVAELQLRSDHQDLILRTASAYFDVLAGQDTLATIEAQRTATTQALLEAKKNFEVGNATITDTHEAQARYDLVVAQEILAQSDLEVKRSSLGAIVGQTTVSVLPLRAGTQFSVDNIEPLSTWLERATANSPRLLMQQINEKIADKEVARADAGHMPTLNLVAGYNRVIDPMAISSSFSNHSTSISLQLSVPIYTGGGLSSAGRAAVDLRQKAGMQTEAVRRDTESHLRAAYLNATSSIARIHALDQALISSKSALDSTVLGRQIGVRTNLDVLNAQQQYYSAARDLSQVKYQYLVFRLQLAALAGQLNTEVLLTINRLLG